MDKLKYPTIVIILIMVLSLTGLSMNVSARPLAATSPTLGTADSYSVLAGQTVTNVAGATTITGNVGVSSGPLAPPANIVGFPPGIIGPPGVKHDTDANALLAQAANTTAFGDLSAGDNAACTQDFGNVVTDLTGMSLGPGVYCTDVTGTTGAFTLSGTLTLTGSGVWIFRSGSTLITSGTAKVVGGDPCNVWWLVPSSATLGTNTSLIGNILALTSISLATGAKLNGRALAQVGSVTLDTNTISAPICAAQLTQTAVAATLTAVPTNTATRTPTNTATRTSTSIPTSTPRPGVLPGTGFSPNGVTVLSNQSADKAYAAMGDLWLEIPKLGVQMNIVGVPETGGTWDVSWLGKQAGWLNGSAFPTWAGNSVLTGHVLNADNTVGQFRYINTLWWGDKVIVHAWGAKYVYEVRSVIQVGPGNTTAMMKHETIPWVTLVTCRGYDQASDSYKYRVLVRAVLIEVK